MEIFFIVFTLCVVSQAELNSRQMVSTEIAKALEESRRQKEDLQTQVCGLAHAQSILQ